MPTINKIFTFLIPVRIDSPARLANLTAVVKYYMRAFDGEGDEVSFIILEADAETRMHGIFDGDNIRHVFVHDDNKIFHRTRYINQMLRLVTTPIAAVLDADVIVPPCQIESAVSILSESKHDVMVYPYGGIFWSVGIGYSELFRTSLDLSVLADVPQPRALMCGYHSVGGAFLVDVERYRKCGWENENFVGWGPEDAERYARLEMLGRKPKRVDGMMYHLYHPRGINSGMSDADLALSTKKEYCKVCSMQVDELEAYVKEWRWTE